MLLRKIILEDFGIYGGRNEFDVTSSESQSIILFCGTNGAGKTTLFESVSLCLYGHGSIEPKITQKQYNQKILKSFHICHKKRSKNSLISVEFDYYHAGSITGYKVTRSWYNDAGKPVENLTVLKKLEQDGSFVELDIMEKSQWQTFIDQILPKGITKLFFFDGEKIEKISQSGNEDEYIKSSFDALLGLDLVHQLHRDVGLYILRNSDDQTQSILDEIDQNTAQKKALEEQIEHFQEKQIYLQAEIEQVRRTLASHEAKFTSLGGQFAQKRQELMAQKAKMEQQISDLEDEIRDICSDTLPLSLIPEQMDKLRRDIAFDMKKLQEQFERQILQDGFDDIAGRMERLLKLDDSTRRDVIAMLRQAVREKIDSLPKPENLFFNMSLEDMHNMIYEIEDISEFDKSEIADYAKEYEELVHSLGQVNSNLELAPQQDDIGPIFTQITQAGRELSELEKDLENLKNLEAQKKTQVILINAKIRKILTKKKMDDRRTAGVEIAPKVQDVLEQYAQELRLKKVSLLESNILSSINTLFHKKGFIQNISINSDTFEIRLYNDDLEEITRDMLSQGELQIYATAIVWGLAKTSGRPLPFIIDTPLARLDNKHRESLVSNFYLHASHQVVIFSTDSEVIPSYYEILKDDVSKTVTIQYDKERNKTLQKEGYFMEDTIEV